MIKSVLLKKIGYKVLSIVCRNGITTHINDTPIKLPVYHFRLFPKDYEKSNFAFVKSNVKQGDVVLDIGAHIGLMAVLFGKMVGPKGKVFAFEPTPGSFKNLCNTIKYNKLPDVVTPVNMPVTEKSGPVNFFISDNDVDVANTLSPWESEKELNTLKTQATSIDDFVSDKKLPKVDFIKIDAEGVELGVLKGGYKTAMQFRPKINLAIHPSAIVANGDTLEEIYDLVKELKYDIFLDDNQLSREAFCREKGLFDVHLFAAK